MRRRICVALACAGCLDASGGEKPRDAAPVVDAGVELAWHHVLGDVEPHLALDDDRLALTGPFTGPVQIGTLSVSNGASVPDILLAGLQTDGKPLYMKAYGGPDAVEIPHGIAFDRANGHVVVIGTYEMASASAGGEPFPFVDGSGGFVARYDEEGEHRWSLTMRSGIAAHPGAVHSTGGGSTAVMGFFHGGDLFVEGQNRPVQEAFEAFYAEVSPSGALAELESYVGPQNQVGGCAIHDDLGGIYLVGISSGEFMLGGTPVPFSGAPDTSDVFAVRTTSAGGTADWVARAKRAASVLDLRCARLPAGDLLVGISFGGSIELDGVDGPFEIESRGGQDAVLLALAASDGELLWWQHLGGAGDDRVHALDAIAGRVAATGLFHGTARIGEQDLSSAGGSDAFLLMLDGDGAPRWATRHGGDGDDEGMSVVLDEGALYVAAMFSESIDLAGELLTNPGDTATGVVARLDGPASR